MKRVRMQVRRAQTGASRAGDSATLLLSPFSSGLTKSFDAAKAVDVEDEKPIWNPFTSSYAHRDTDFEAGPSVRRSTTELASAVTVSPRILNVRISTVQPTKFV